MGLGSKLVESLEIQEKNEGFSLVFTRTHNIRLVKHYKKSREAKLLLKVPLGTYESHLLEWSIWLFEIWKIMIYEDEEYIKQKG